MSGERPKLKLGLRAPAPADGDEFAGLERLDRRELDEEDTDAAAIEPTGRRVA